MLEDDKGKHVLTCIDVVSARRDTYRLCYGEEGGDLF